MDKRKIEELIAKAEELYKRWPRQRLLRFLSDTRLAACNDARLYKLKGMVLRRFKRFKDKKPLKEAINAFTEAIKLEPNDPSLYRERGETWRRMRDRKRALKDLDVAISLNPKDPDSYVVRAQVWLAFRKYKESTQDFAAAIRLNPKKPRPYYARRVLWRQLRNQTNEIKDLAIALRLDPKPIAPMYVYLGDLYYRKKKYSLAFEQYNRAMDMDPTVYLSEVDSVQVNMFNATASLNDGQRRKIYEACIPISGFIATIRDLTDPSFAENHENILKPVVHFTKLPVADILLSSDENRFRFYHVSYMNDPQEGKILLQILKDPAIEESYSASSRYEESNFYIGSFLPATLADELVMWRTYGKDETESEAKGCSIIISRKFFDEESALSQARQDVQGGLKSRETKRDKTSRTQYDTQLHKVIYYDKKNNTLLGVGVSKGDEIMKELRKLRFRLRKIIDRFKESHEKHLAINRAIDRLVYSVITEVSYYFKSSDYRYEYEERVILSVPPKSPLVKIEEGTYLPKRLYVEARSPIRKHIKKIVLGPRVVHPERWSYLKVKMIKDNNDLELVKSSTKFQ